MLPLLNHLIHNYVLPILKHYRTKLFSRPYLLDIVFMENGLCHNRNNQSASESANSSYSPGGRAKPDERTSRKRKGRIIVVDRQGNPSKTVCDQETSSTQNDLEVVIDNRTIPERITPLSWSSEDIQQIANQISCNLSQSVFQQFNSQLKEIGTCIDKVTVRMERLELLLLQEDSGDEGDD